MPIVSVMFYSLYYLNFANQRQTKVGCVLHSAIRDCDRATPQRTWSALEQISDVQSLNFYKRWNIMKNIPKF